MKLKFLLGFTFVREKLTEILFMSEKKSLTVFSLQGHPFPFKILRLI